MRTKHIDFSSRFTRAFSINEFFFLATVNQRRKIFQKEKLQRRKSLKEKYSRKVYQ